MLHHVNDDKAYDSLKPFCISKNSFLQLLDYLDKNAYQTIVFGDLQSNNKTLKGKKKVILSFDDCPKHLLEFVLPELVKRNMKAVFYMPTAHIGLHNSWDSEEGRTKVDLMDKADLCQLVSAGMELGAHGHQHIKLKNIEEESEIAFQVAHSKKILEDLTGQNILSFAYPFGSVPKSFKRILNTAGYFFAVSIYQPFQNRFALRRFIYHDGDNLKTIRQKLSGTYKLYRFLTDPLKKY
jgi:peptidoglycan/xylan/chitin deacetylase (PgdA/CDA1 family)